MANPTIDPIIDPKGHMWKSILEHPNYGDPLFCVTAFSFCEYCGVLSDENKRHDWCVRFENLIPKVEEMNYEIKDSGKHRDFKTGAKRDSKDGKGRYELLPPFAIHDLAVHYQKGAEKYDARNWEKGIPISEYIDSAKRHINEFEMGLTDENHLIAAIWNLMCGYDTGKRIEHGILPKELDDLPYPLKKKEVEEKQDWVEPDDEGYTNT